ncbi:hypothetical protein Lalb_Chr25g0282271 [Lupinus albus]|uniref:Uncharacterized protein n=1 Tax=Lupinus albus TaxID=3870 RepID=A0A6A4NBI0_LUPAL|nr:hypothetical protein Lalb_Chr25g0282271 [Lupinus albus]
MCSISYLHLHWICHAIYSVCNNLLLPTLLNFYFGNLKLFLSNRRAIGYQSSKKFITTRCVIDEILV